MKLTLLILTLAAFSGCASKPTFKTSPVERREYSAYVPGGPEAGRQVRYYSLDSGSGRYYSDTVAWSYVE